MIVKPARLLLALTAMVALPSFAQNIATVNGKPILEQDVRDWIEKDRDRGRVTSRNEALDRIPGEMERSNLRNVSRASVAPDAFKASIVAVPKFTAA